MATDFTHINAALTRTGNVTITSFDQGTAESNVMTENYEVIVGEEMSNYRWKWATKFQPLNRLTDTAPAPWLYGYQRPEDVLNLRTIRQSGSPIAYAVMGQVIMANAIDTTVSVIAEYIWRVPESDWPWWFAGPLTKRLEALCLRALGERHGEAAARDKIADDGFAKACRLDAQSQPPVDPYRYPILTARNG